LNDWRREQPSREGGGGGGGKRGFLSTWVRREHEICGEKGTRFWKRNPAGIGGGVGKRNSIVMPPCDGVLLSIFRRAPQKEGRDAQDHHLGERGGRLRM